MKCESLVKISMLDLKSTALKVGTHFLGTEWNYTCLDASEEIWVLERNVPC